MKILVATPYYHPQIGGLENYAHRLALALRQTTGDEVVIVTSGQKRSSREIVDGITIYRLATWFKLSNTPVNLFWPLMIKRIIRQEKPDIIHAHSPVPSMADAAALAAGRIPFVLTYHASTLRKETGKYLGIITRLYELYQRVTLQRANQIVAVSDYVKSQLSDSLQDKIAVIPNSIGKEEIAGRMQPDGPNFIFIGSLDKSHNWKGLELIIRAVADYKSRHGNDITLQIIGDGNHRQAYANLVKDLGLTSNVQFAGALTGRKKYDLLTTSTALIAYPTTGNDAFPTVFLEAWAKGVPVIAAAIGPLPCLISSGLNGYLVSPNNITALSDTLFRVLNDKSGRTAVAAAGINQTSQRYTWERQAVAMHNLLELQL